VRNDAEAVKWVRIAAAQNLAAAMANLALCRQLQAAAGQCRKQADDGAWCCDRRRDIYELADCR
jgi:TPR repeat protein